MFVECVTHGVKNYWQVCRAILPLKENFQMHKYAVAGQFICIKQEWICSGQGSVFLQPHSIGHYYVGVSNSDFPGTDSQPGAFVQQGPVEQKK